MNIEAIKLFKQPVTISIALSLLVFIALILLRNTGSLQALELLAYDTTLAATLKQQKATPPVTLIGITEADIQQHGQWPLNDSQLAQLLEKIITAQPAAIGLDIYRDMAIPPGTDELNRTLTRHENIFAVKKFSDDQTIGIKPPAILRNTERFGFNDIIEDPGGIVRRGLLFLDDDSGVWYAFPLRLALHYLQTYNIKPQPDESHPEFIKLGNTTLPPLEANAGSYVNIDTQGYQYLLDFRDTADTLPRFSMTELLANKVPQQFLKNRIILVGVTAESVKDFFTVPATKRFQIREKIDGITLHALTISQLLRMALNNQPPLTTLSNYQELLWILLWSTAGGLLGLWARSAHHLLAITLAGWFALAALSYSSLAASLWIPFVPAALGWAGAIALTTAYMVHHEKDQRALLMQLFSRHVSPEIADTVWHQRDKFLKDGRLQPQQLTATVVFLDLKGFTSLSEHLQPQQLMDWLNTYMENMGKLIMAHGGVIDDYFGDGIKANFGVPIPRTDQQAIQQDAVNAVRCSLAMGHAMVQTNQTWQQQGYPAMGLRIGINTGTLVAGSLGSKQRLKYTTVGDAVNTAARLETYDKAHFSVTSSEHPYRILVSGSTQQLVESQFSMQKIGNVNLRGKSAPIAVFQVHDIQATHEVTLEREAAL